MCLMATERIVAGLKGGDDDELLVRRAARLAGRGGGELLAVHVRTPSGTRGDSPRALEDQKRAVAGLGGEYHALAGTDVAQALLDYARSVRATHILVGQSRRRRIAGLFRGSVEARVVRDAGDIDVQVVPRDPAVHPMRRARTELGRGRTLAGFALAAFLPAGLQLLLAVQDHSVATAVLVQLAGAVAVALVGGLWPAVAGALWSSLLVNYFSTPPVGDLAIHDPQDVLALGVFVGVSVAVAGVVDGSARRSKEAALARAEAATLADLALGASRSEDSLQALLSESLSVFGVSGAAVVTAAADPPQPDWGLLAGAGDIPDWDEGPDGAAARTAEELGSRTWLLLFGREIPRAERRLLDAFGVHVRARLERRQLEASRLEISRLAEGNAMRTAILRAVSHDLRTPLAGIKLAAGGLLQDGVGYGPEERRELLETIDECTDRLDGLVGNLLDMSGSPPVRGTLEPSAGDLDHALRTCPRRRSSGGPSRQHAGCGSGPRAAGARHRQYRGECAEVRPRCGHHHIRYPDAAGRPRRPPRRRAAHHRLRPGCPGPQGGGNVPAVPAAGGRGPGNRHRAGTGRGKGFHGGDGRKPRR